MKLKLSLFSDKALKERITIKNPQNIATLYIFYVFYIIYMTRCIIHSLYFRKMHKIRIYA